MNRNQGNQCKQPRHPTPKEKKIAGGIAQTPGSRLRDGLHTFDYLAHKTCTFCPCYNTMAQNAFFLLNYVQYARFSKACQ